MSFWTTVLLIVVVGHFVVGFGYLMYKLSPKKKDKQESSTEDADDEHH